MIPMKHFLAAIALPLFFFATAVSAENVPAGGFGVSIGPSIVRLSGKPGESQSAKVKVWNKSPNPMKFSLSVRDVGNQADSDGRLDRIFPPPGTLPHSCAKWILLQEKEFEIPPGGEKEVELIVSSPADASGGKAAVVFFTGVPGTPPPGGSQKEKPAASIQIVPRLGALVFFETEGTLKRTGQITDFSVQPLTESSSLEVRYFFENLGNTDIFVSGTFYILDLNKALVAKENLDSMRTFPADKGMGKSQWKGILNPGSYHLVATFELGQDTEEVIIKEADFVIPPAAP